jgi:hypothetical protein
MPKQMQITGENIIHAIEFYKRKRGTDGLVELSGELDFDVNNIFEERWYPIEMYTKLLENFDNKFDYTDYSVSFRIGFDRSRRIGLLNNGGGNIDPRKMFKKIKENWWRFNNFGKVEYRELAENHVNIYLCESIEHPLYCERMRGFFAGILREVCRQKEPRIKKTNCLSCGDKYCKFEATWKMPELQL